MACFFAVIALLITAPAHAQSPAASYPAKPIRMLSPFAAGGSTDTLARAIGQRMTETWGQPVIVENRPGAGGQLAADFLAKAPPDGYIMLLTSVSAHAIGPAMSSKLPYDPVRDFAAVSQVASGHNVLVVHPSLPARSVRELVALAKARPGQITFSSGGAGTTTHMAAELFKTMTHTDMLHVPYKGGAPASLAVLSGEVSVLFGSIATVLPHIKSGRERVLAVTGTQRAAALPDVPTVSEAGVPGYEMNSWYGVLAPAATPQDIVNKAGTEIARIVKLPQVRERLSHEGLEPAGTTPQAFAAYIKVEVAKWAKVARSAGIKIE
jgi:tripartite-type tricarboxylate transporter receptor subunit TctC